MAYTKIHAVKATINKAIDYICNPAKTDEKILIDSFGTAPETAHFDFKATLSKTSSADPNLAFHLIQSFAPGEVSYDEAHKIGIELADKLLEGKYSYVVATHIDHNHVHNHIMFCAADNINHKKYHDCKTSYHRIRQLSDELCAEHNLSIIKPSPKRGMKYNEWATRKNGTSWKAQLQTDIDETIKTAKSYENFIELMKAKGYEIKGEEFGENASKYISFRPLEGKQFIRGSDRAFGPGYTKENIRDRITENIKQQSKTKIPFPKRPDPMEQIKTKTVEDIIGRKTKDLTRERKYRIINPTDPNAPKFIGRANVNNLKAAAHAYAVMEDMNTVQSKIEEMEELIKTTKSSLVSLEKKMKPAAEILHYAEIYKANLRYHNAMERSKDPDRYYREHDQQINLFNAAEHVLRDKYGIDPSKMNYQNMLEGYQLMEDKKVTLTSNWKQYEKDLHELQSQLENFQKFMASTGAESMQSHVHEENHEEEQKQPEDDKSQPNKKGQSL